jgi:uncharacterized protein YkwD
MNKTALALFFFLLSFWLPGSSRLLENPEGTANHAPGTWQKEMLGLVNQARSKGCRCGGKYMPPTPPVKWNDRLALAAQSHAADMDRHHFIGHRGSTGSKIGERATRAGYDWQSVGENVAWGDLSVKMAVIGWLDSPGHCLTLMHRGYKEMGAARQGQYYVQLFGRRWK